MSVYIVAQLKFTRRELYDRYQARFFEVFRKFKGRLLVADEQPMVLEGSFERDKVVVLEFPDQEAAMEFHNSSEYAAIAVDRKADADAIVENRELSGDVVKLLRARHEIRSIQLPQSLDPDTCDVPVAGAALTRELIAAERKLIHALLRDGRITDEARRRIERDLDLEEASLANREYRATPL